MTKSGDHRHLFVGRVRRTELEGETVGITLDLYKDQDSIELAEGDEFVTLLLAIDPFEKKAG